MLLRKLETLTVCMWCFKAGCTRTDKIVVVAVPDKIVVVAVPDIGGTGISCNFFF
jgi:hypothetical protein